MAVRFIITLSILFVLSQGSHIQVEPETAVEAHQVGGVTSGAAIRFPEVRPAPQSPSSAGGYRGRAGANTASRPAVATRPKAAPRPAASAPRRPPGGPHSRPSAGGNPGRPNNGGAGFGNPHQNRNRIQKPY